jgi:hypothetical protein
MRRNAVDDDEAAAMRSAIRHATIAPFVMEKARDRPCLAIDF